MCPPNFEAVNILGKIGTARSIPVLTSAARSADAHLAQAARNALEAIGQRERNEPKG